MKTNHRDGTKKRRDHRPDCGAYASQTLKGYSTYKTRSKDGAMLQGIRCGKIDPDSASLDITSRAAFGTARRAHA